MKIAFSTLCCPGWSWNEILAAAKDLGYDGVEIRGLAHEMFAPRAKPFLPENMGETKKRLRGLGLDIPCLSSACVLTDIENQDKTELEVRAYIDLAESLGTPYIRVLADFTPGPPEDATPDAERAVSLLRMLGEYAGQSGVTLLVETNGFLADSSAMLNFILAAESKSVGVLWDVHHPFRYFNEPASLTWGRLKDYIRYIHMKDSVLENGDIHYKMPGVGDNPNSETIKLLKEGGFDGFVSLEWVKRWNNNLEEPGIVLPHFVNYVRSLLG